MGCEKVSHRKIHMGIIGLGAIGNRIINQIKNQNLGDLIEVTAVCDVNPSLAEETAERLGGIYWTTEYIRLLEQPEIDLVYVAVPPAFHHPIVLKAIEYKKHLFCEKPLANSLSEAAEMAKAAQNAGIIHAMHFPLNYEPALNRFSQLLSEGYIGELRRIRLEMHFPQWPRKWQQNGWVASRKQGGFTLEVGVHWIQAIQKIFGQITHVQSQLHYPADPEKSETSIIGQMMLENGIPVTIDGISHVAGEERIAFTAYGTEGTLSIVNWGKLFAGKVGSLIEELPLDDVPPRLSVLANIAKAIHGEPAEIYDFKVGFNAQVVLEALRNSVSDHLVDITEDYKLV